MFAAAFSFPFGTVTEKEREDVIKAQVEMVVQKILNGDWQVRLGLTTVAITWERAVRNCLRTRGTFARARRCLFPAYRPARRAALAPPAL